MCTRWRKRWRSAAPLLSFLETWSCGCGVHLRAHQTKKKIYFSILSSAKEHKRRWLAVDVCIPNEQCCKREAPLDSSLCWLDVVVEESLKLWGRDCFYYWGQKWQKPTFPASLAAKVWESLRERETEREGGRGGRERERKIEPDSICPWSQADPLPFTIHQNCLVIWVGIHRSPHLFP